MIGPSLIGEGRGLFTSILVSENNFMLQIWAVEDMNARDIVANFPFICIIQV